MKTSYPLFTVVVFAGAPTSNHLTEAYRRHWDGTPEGLEAATRYASQTVRGTRTDFAGTGRAFVPPSAVIFEDSPSRGLGRMVLERNSSARRKYLAAVAAGERMP